MATEQDREVRGFNGQRYLSIDEIAALQPGLGRIMPEIGQRAAKLYYAVRAGNWPLAHFQLGEIRELIELGAFTRPKYEVDLRTFLEECLGPLEQAIRTQDSESFEDRFRRAVERANAYHAKHAKPFLTWKLPERPPEDLDLTPR